MTTTSAERVGLEVRGVMIQRGRTQGEAAEVLGLSQQAVSRRLRGRIPFDVPELLLIASWLEVDAASLLPGVAA